MVALRQILDTLRLRIVAGAKRVWLASAAAGRWVGRLPSSVRGSRGLRGLRGLLELRDLRELRGRQAQRTGPSAFDTALESARAQMLASDSLDARQKDWLRAVSPAIAPGDQMYVDGEGQHYLGVGLSALDNVELALERANTTREEVDGGKLGPARTVRRVLDFPCGYGRVLRFLRARFPDARFVGCELQPEAVEFCRRQFGIRTAPSEPNFERIELEQYFDLIWCGSLVTHLDPDSTRALLACFDRHLAPGGLVLFTTHGQATDDLLRTGERSYSLSRAAQTKVLAEYDAEGFGFAEYDDWPGYGISLTHPDAIRRIAERASGGSWSEVLYRERGWDGHQDVFAFEKRAAEL